MQTQFDDWCKLTEFTPILSGKTSIKAQTGETPGTPPMEGACRSPHAMLSIIIRALHFQHSNNLTPFIDDGASSAPGNISVVSLQTLEYTVTMGVL